MTWIVTSICGGCRCGIGVAYHMFSVFCQFLLQSQCHPQVSIVVMQSQAVFRAVTHDSGCSSKYGTYHPLLMVALHSQMPCSLNSPCQFFILAVISMRHTPIHI